tara:strand:+ start:9400 stop:10029 length:630 start_codon:yes stop_codon:yes gene_type:complete
VYQLIFAHGWGFDQTFWQKLSEKFSNRYDVLMVDFGYTGNKVVTLDNLNEKKAICIGHSLGVLWLLKNVSNPRALISISGFIGYQSFFGINKIQKMKRILLKNTATQMKLFYKHTGFNVTPTITFDTEALVDGLEYLQFGDASKELSKLKCPVLAITSRDDRIMPQGIAKKIWKNHNLHVLRDGGHVTPVSKVDECESLIKNFLIDNEL